MLALTREHVEKTLAERKFAALRGVREGEFFEAKGAKPYDFATPDGRYELAKDVSALANASGGWLIVGLKTTPLATEAADAVSSLDLIPEPDFDAARIKGLLNDHVHPSIAGLGVYWAADAENPGLGAGVIHVPEQKVDSKPFLITRVVEDGVHVKGIVFGYARRMRADSTPHTAAQLHQAMRVGMNTTAQRLTSLEEKVDKVLDLLVGGAVASGAPQTERSPRDQVVARIDDILAT
jgi:predicted HTH transcriptional regulator